MKRTIAAIGFGAMATLGLTAPQAVAGEVGVQTVSCIKSVGGTGGWVECTGSGQWRTVSICDFEADRTSVWYSQSGGTLRKNVLECRFDLADIRIEKR
ncbi:hypothetical protein ACFT7S_31350 [Streptomyces sp. NPDC057136]|uniref:hypothetical protein n=1 Tax=Streptomyces sp. NPDC057136 TaxID=3346029 RepID=UPI00363137B4